MSLLHGIPIDLSVLSDLTFPSMVFHEDGHVPTHFSLLKSFEEATMRRERALKAVLVLVGLLFWAGVYPVTESLWHANQSMYTDDMMLSLYVALGIFLLIAVRNPSANRSLIAFTAWSSFAHAAVMAVMAFQKPDERGGFLGGVAALAIIGVALIVLAPESSQASGHRRSVSRVSPVFPANGYSLATRWADHREGS